MNEADKVKTATFQILFTSDIHGAFRDYNYATGEPARAGFARAATLMKKERDSFPGQTFLFDCGDCIQGNGTSVLVGHPDYRPFPLYAAFDAIGYDGVILGNHEFNFGYEKLCASIEGYKGAKLCGNVYRHGKLLEGFAPYVIKTVPNGPRVAFIAMVSPNIVIWDKENTQKDGIIAWDAAVETQKIITELKEHDLADLFVLLGHMDEKNEMDTPGSGCEDILKQNSELTVFLGAHFHLMKGRKEEQLVHCGTKFAENLAGAESYGKVTITATCEGGTWRVQNKSGGYATSDVKTDIIPVPDTIANDPAVEAVTEKAHRFVREYMETTVVGTLLNGPLLPQPRIKGTHEGILTSNALIRLVTDVMLHYSGADIAAASLNAFTANCPEGPITLGKIAQIYVYDNNTLYTVQLTGKQLLQWMEWSYAYFGVSLDEAGPAVNVETDLTIPYGVRKVYLFDQFAGFRYTVDLTRPIGQRITITSPIAGKPFSLEATYVAATTNYRATTNLLLTSSTGIFKPGEPTARLERMDIQSDKNSINMLDLLREFIGMQPGGSISSVCEPNWEFINLNWDEKLRAKAVELINADALDIPYSYTRVVTKKEVLGK